MTFSFDLKLSLSNGKVLRVTIDVPALSDFTFEQLCQHVAKLSPSADLSTLSWIDEEWETISLDSDAGVANALRNLPRISGGDGAPRILLVYANVAHSVGSDQPGPRWQTGGVARAQSTAGTGLLVPGHPAHNRGLTPGGVGQQMPSIYFLPGGGFRLVGAQQSLGVHGRQQALMQQRMAGMQPAVQRPGINQAMLVQQQRAAAIASQQKVVDWMQADGSNVTPSTRNPAATGPQGGSHKFGKQHHNQTPQQSILIQGQEPLTVAMLARASLQEQKQMLGERLFPLISVTHRDLAGKLTGMLLEMENSEILHMLKSEEALRVKVAEAVDVIRTHKTKNAKKEG